MDQDQIVFDGSCLTIENIVDVARQNNQYHLSNQNQFVERIDKGAAFVDKLLKEDQCVYGVTTGYGDSCTVAVPLDLVDQLPIHLYTFHGCGMGDSFNVEETRAILATRLNSLAKGFSGVRYSLLNQIYQLLIFNINPLIPKEGSVGASGDLTPLSYLAAVLAGEREVIYQGQQQTTAVVFAELNIKPLKFKPKEVLAIMNGTAAMTGVACLAWYRAEYLSRLITRITSIAILALQGNDYHYDAKLFSLKPHQGQSQVASRIRQDLLITGDVPRNDGRLQDRYSLRCAPHIIGVLEDALPFLRQLIETELNSVTDNPIIDFETERVLHGGHFYGGHIAMAMDTLKVAVANLADLLDRQFAQLVDTKFNQGLPANLSGAANDQLMLNHGFKALQIAVSSWTAEALKLTMPASVFSRSTECHNQDKVSMGTIAARDCIRVLELTEQAAAALLIATVQALELRDKQFPVSNDIQQTITSLRNHVAFLTVDRALDSELRLCVDLIRSRYWNLYEA